MLFSLQFHPCHSYLQCYVLVLRFTSTLVFLRKYSCFRVVLVTQTCTYSSWFLYPAHRMDPLFLHNTSDYWLSCWSAVGAYLCAMWEHVWIACVTVWVKTRNFHWHWALFWRKGGSLHCRGLALCTVVYCNSQYQLVMRALLVSEWSVWFFLRYGQPAAAGKVRFHSQIT